MKTKKLTRADVVWLDGKRIKIAVLQQNKHSAAGHTKPSARQ